MRDPWVYLLALGKPEWQKRTPILDLIRNLILAVINPSQQMFNWHSSILNNSNNNKARYLPAGKKDHHHHPIPGQLGMFFCWLVGFHLLSALRDNTERMQGCHQVSRLRCNAPLFHTGSGMSQAVGQPMYATFHSKETSLFAVSSP